MKKHVHEPYGPFKRILFCTDFSENAEFAFGFALEQARHAPDARLHILHVVPEPDAQFWRTYVSEVDDVEVRGQAEMHAKIQEDYIRRAPGGIQLEIAIRGGMDHAGILECAREINADLIIIGRQGNSSISKVFFGNVTEKVVRKASCPVLVVPLSFERPQL